ncbi:MAG: GNAT family N-acetyltransferase [Calditrichota bacterium]|jgi:GNAT superfamily N-acetyltransferase
MSNFTKSGLEYHPLTNEQWADFELLFGKRGACGGCWCMWWRLKRSEFNQQKSDGNKSAMKMLVDSGKIPGLIAYQGKVPIGWCSVAPREEFSTLERSRILKPVDNQSVWSIVCFFVNKKFRNRGLTIDLINAAKEFVRQNDGKILEGYPVEPKKGKTADVFAYTGLASAFRNAGFVEVARRSETRPIMRYYLK